MNNIVYVTHPPFAASRPEIELISSLLKFEGYSPTPLYPESEEFKCHYKGGHPAILFYEELDKDPTVIYGFWELVNWFLRHGMVRA
jgi:hypothetical protein